MYEAEIKLLDSDHVIFIYGGTVSRPVKVVYSNEWAWKMLKRSIKSHYSAAELVSHLSDSLWSGIVLKAAQFYCNLKLD